VCAPAYPHTKNPKTTTYDGSNSDARTKVPTHYLREIEE
jgi:hypothetical protein